VADFTPERKSPAQAGLFLVGKHHNGRHHGDDNNTYIHDRPFRKEFPLGDERRECRAQKRHNVRYSPSLGTSTVLIACKKSLSAARRNALLLLRPSDEKQTIHDLHTFFTSILTGCRLLKD